MDLSKLKTPHDLAVDTGVSVASIMKLINSGVLSPDSYTKLGGRYVLDETLVVPLLEAPSNSADTNVMDDPISLTKQLLARGGTSPLDFIRKFGEDTDQGYRIPEPDLLDYYEQADLSALVIKGTLRLQDNYYYIVTILKDDAQDVKDLKSKQLNLGAINDQASKLASVLTPRDFIKQVGTVDIDGYSYVTEQSIMYYYYLLDELERAEADKSIVSPVGSSMYKTEPPAKLVIPLTKVTLTEKNRLNSYRTLVSKYYSAGDFIHECGTFKFKEDSASWEMPLDTVLRYYSKDDVALNLKDDSRIKVITKTEHAIYYLTVDLK